MPEKKGICGECEYFFPDTPSADDGDCGQTGRPTRYEWKECPARTAQRKVEQTLVEKDAEIERLKEQIEGWRKKYEKKIFANE